MEEQLVREWRRFGHHDREWTALKMIVFNEDNKPVCIKIEDYKKKQKEEEKQRVEAAS